MESGGEKLMRSVQDWFAGRVADAEKVDNSGQEPPETTKPEVMLGLVPLPGTAKVSGVLPALTMVTVCGLSVLVEPALVVAKCKAGGSTRSSFQMVDVEWPMKKTLPLPSSATPPISFVPAAIALWMYELPESVSLYGPPL